MWPGSATVTVTRGCDAAGRLPRSRTAKHDPREARRIRRHAAVRRTVAAHSRTCAPRAPGRGGPSRARQLRRRHDARNAPRTCLLGRVLRMKSATRCSRPAAFDARAPHRARDANSAAWRRSACAVRALDLGSRSVWRRGSRTPERRTACRRRRAEAPVRPPGGARGDATILLITCVDAACSFSAARAAQNAAQPSLPSWRACSKIGCSSSRVSRIPKVHGFAHVVASSNVIDHSTCSSTSAGSARSSSARSRRRRTPTPRGSCDASTTSVSPSQWPRESPIVTTACARQRLAAVERDDARLVHHLVADGHHARRSARSRTSCRRSPASSSRARRA